MAIKSCEPSFKDAARRDTQVAGPYGRSNNRLKDVKGGRSGECGKRGCA